VINTSSIRAFSEGSERGLGEEIACRKNIGRNTELSALFLSELEIRATFGGS